MMGVIKYLEDGGYDLYRGIGVGMLVVSFSVSLLLAFLKAPYGRYSGTLSFLDFLPRIPPLLNWVP